jgi:penicillin-binding protein-related factor A (putative recombinase)
MTLAGVEAATPQGDRGKFWEGVLERTHDVYARRGTGKIYHLPNDWAFCHPATISRLNLPGEMWARTGAGRTIRRVKSGPDFVGGFGGRHVEFDAKEFMGASIPLEKSFTLHQVEKLRQAERSGSLAGFMILAKRTMTAYWLLASQVLRLLDLLRFNQLPCKSLNLAWLDEHAKTLGQVSPVGIFDWAAVLVPEETL